MKKVIKSRIFAFTLGSIVFGSVGVVSAYTLLANDIGYTPKNTTWKVNNIKEALDDLYEKSSNGLQSIKGYYQFVNGDNNFTTTSGEVTYNSLGVSVKTYDDNGIAEIEKELSNPIVLSNSFEISTQLFINNSNSSSGGRIEINLYQKNSDNYTLVGNINMGDDWAASNQIGFYYKFKESEQIINNSYTNAWTTTNPSGRYALIGKNNKIYLYRGDILLGSINCDFSEGVNIDKISIKYSKFNDIAFSTLPIIVEDIYVGNPLYYKSIIQGME